jgi:radical SAM protein with 4Fe4S-binding SPASM domain
MSSLLKSISLFSRQSLLLPQTLNFFVTSRCNARCDFCLYYDQIENPVAQEKELRTDEVEKIAEQYGRLHYLALSGGEPFVRKDLEPICQAFINHCGTSVIGIPSNFFYTATMVSTLEPLTRKNPEVIFELQMSIDHIGQMHDESRKVQGLYDRAIESFKALSAIRGKHPNLKLKISIVYLERNKNCLEKIVTELLRTVACDRIQLSYPNQLISCEPNDNPAHRQEVKTFVQSANWIDHHFLPQNKWDLHTLGMRSVKDIYHRLLLEAVTGKRSVGSYCEAGRHIVVINEKGDVFPCEPLWHCIGNLRESNYSMKAVLASRAYQDFRAKHLGPSKCNCTWGCAMHSHIAVEHRYLPRLLLNATQLAIGSVWKYQR